MEVHSLWVTDFDSREMLVPASEAFYLVSPALESPMGLGVAAFRTAADRGDAAREVGGTPMSWEEVVPHVRSGWEERTRSAAHGGHSVAAPVPTSHGSGA